MIHGHLDYFQKPPLGGKPNTKLRAHGTPKFHSCWFVIFYHLWGPYMNRVHWNSIWLRARLHMTSHYTWGVVTTLHDLESVLGWPLDTSFGLSQFHGHNYWLMGEVVLMASSHGVPSPTHVSKSQLLKPQETIKTSLIIINVGSWIFYVKIFARLGLRVGSSFLLDPSFNTSRKPHLQKALPCKLPCHTWDLRLETPCEVVSPNLYALNN